MKNLILITSRWLALALISGLAFVGCGGSTDFNSSAFNVGGTVSGLNNSTSVRLTYGNSANTVTVAQNGSFQFPQSLPFNTSYAVTVATQPTNQTCIVTNGSGNARATVTNITVSCVTNGYTIGGTVSGLTGTVVLSNGGETLSVTSNGSFTFPTLVTSTYGVSVTSNPGAGMYCSVSRGSGTPSANVTNVRVACTSSVANPSCSAGQFMTGISGGKGSIIDRVAVICADVVSSVIDTINAVEGAFVGGAGGQAFSPFNCPAGEWVSSISGNNGSFAGVSVLASIQATCSGGSQSPAYNSGVSGFTSSCPSGKRSTGFVISPANATNGGTYAGTMSNASLTCEP